MRKNRKINSISKCDFLSKCKITTFLSVIIAWVVIFSTNVFAAGTVDLQASTDSCVLGDEVKVTVNIHDAGSATKPEISVTYDPNRLSFVDCSSEYGGGGGGLITLTDAVSEITFVTVSGGPAEVKVSAIFDGDGANASESSVLISVEGEDTAEGMGEEMSTDTGIEAGTIQSSDGSKYVSSVFANEFMPVGFYKTSVTYEEQMVEAAQFDMGNIVLLYVTDENGNNGNFDIYNQETGELTDFLQIMGIENRFIIVLKAPEDIQAPSDFTKTTLQWNDQVLDAYAYSGTGFTGDTNPAEFFIVYAVSSTGNKGFYLYDQNEGTYQRYVEGFRETSNSSNSDDSESKSVIEEMAGGVLSKVTNNDSNDTKGGLDIKLIIIVILAIITVTLLVLFIITLVKLKDYESYDYIDEDEEFEDEKPVKVKKDDGLIYPENNFQSDPSKKVKASDLVERDMADKKDKEYNKLAEQPKDIKKEKKIEDPKDDLGIEEIDIDSSGSGLVTSERRAEADDLSDTYDNEFRASGRKQTKEEKKLAKAEAKAAKREAKRIKREYGENGFVDWESFGETIKNNETEMPKAKANPTYVLEDDAPSKKQHEDDSELTLNEDRPLRNNKKSDKIKIEPVDAVKDSTINIEPVIKEVQKLEKEGKLKSQSEEKPKRNYEEMRNQEIVKENPAEMMRNIPANDNNKPVQPKPVQQYDFDDDFEFEFLKLDDED